MGAAFASPWLPALGSEQQRLLALSYEAVALRVNTLHRLGPVLDNLESSVRERLAAAPVGYGEGVEWVPRGMFPDAKAAADRGIDHLLHVVVIKVMGIL